MSNPNIEQIVQDGINTLNPSQLDIKNRFVTLLCKQNISNSDIEDFIVFLQFFNTNNPPVTIETLKKWRSDAIEENTAEKNQFEHNAQQIILMIENNGGDSILLTATSQPDSQELAQMDTLSSVIPQLPLENTNRSSHSSSSSSSSTSISSQLPEFSPFLTTPEVQIGCAENQIASNVPEKIAYALISIQSERIFVNHYGSLLMQALDHHQQATDPQVQQSLLKLIQGIIETIFDNMKHGNEGTVNAILESITGQPRLINYFKRYGEKSSNNLILKGFLAILNNYESHNRDTRTFLNVRSYFIPQLEASAPDFTKITEEIIGLHTKDSEIQQKTEWDSASSQNTTTTATTTKSKPTIFSSNSSSTSHSSSSSSTQSSDEEDFSLKSLQDAVNTLESSTDATQIDNGILKTDNDGNTAPQQLFLLMMKYCEKSDYVEQEILASQMIQKLLEKSSDEHIYGLLLLENNDNENFLQTYYKFLKLLEKHEGYHTQKIRHNLKDVMERCELLAKKLENTNFSSHSSSPSNTSIEQPTQDDIIARIMSGDTTQIEAAKILIKNNPTLVNHELLLHTLDCHNQATNSTVQPLLFTVIPTILEIMRPNIRKDSPETGSIVELIIKLITEQPDLVDHLAKHSEIDNISKTFSSILEKYKKEKWDKHVLFSRLLPFLMTHLKSIQATQLVELYKVYQQYLQKQEFQQKKEWSSTSTLSSSSSSNTSSSTPKIEQELRTMFIKLCQGGKLIEQWDLYEQFLSSASTWSAPNKKELIEQWLNEAEDGTDEGRRDVSRNGKELILQLETYELQKTTLGSRISGDNLKETSNALKTVLDDRSHQPLPPIGQRLRDDIPNTTNNSSSSTNTSSRTPNELYDKFAVLCLENKLFIDSDESYVSGILIALINEWNNTSEELVTDNLLQGWLMEIASANKTQQENILLNGTFIIQNLKKLNCIVVSRNVTTLENTNPPSNSNSTNNSSSSTTSSVSSESSKKLVINDFDQLFLNFRELCTAKTSDDALNNKIPEFAELARTTNQTLSKKLVDEWLKMIVDSPEISAKNSVEDYGKYIISVLMRNKVIDDPTTIPTPSAPPAPSNLTSKNPPSSSTETSITQQELRNMFITLCQKDPIQQWSLLVKFLPIAATWSATNKKELFEKWSRDAVPPDASEGTKKEIRDNKDQVMFQLEAYIAPNPNIGSTTSVKPQPDSQSLLPNYLAEQLYSLVISHKKATSNTQRSQAIEEINKLLKTITPEYMLNTDLSRNTLLHHFSRYINKEGPSVLCSEITRILLETAPIKELSLIRNQQGETFFKICYDTLQALIPLYQKNKSVSYIFNRLQDGMLRWAFIVPPGTPLKNEIYHLFLAYGNKTAVNSAIIHFNHLQLNVVWNLLKKHPRLLRQHATLDARLDMTKIISPDTLWTYVLQSYEKVQNLNVFRLLQEIIKIATVDDILEKNNNGNTPWHLLCHGRFTNSKNPGNTQKARAYHELMMQFLEKMLDELKELYEQEKYQEADEILETLLEMKYNDQNFLQIYESISTDKALPDPRIEELLDRLRDHITAYKEDQEQQELENTVTSSNSSSNTEEIPQNNSPIISTTTPKPKPTILSDFQSQINQCKDILKRLENPCSKSNSTPTNSSSSSTSTSSSTDNSTVSQQLASSIPFLSKTPNTNSSTISPSVTIDPSSLSK